jgi:hypothetical protein
MLLVGTAACASSGARPASGNPFAQDLAESKQIQIRILNLHFSDATVWALARDARRERLGTVTGKSEATFTIPWTFSEPLRLEFDLLADVRCVTEEISVDPGDVLELQITADPGSDPSCR